MTFIYLVSLIIAVPLLLVIYLASRAGQIIDDDYRERED